MTTKSSIQNIKSRFSSSNSAHSMATNDNDKKQSRIHVKKPFSTTNFLQNNSTTNGFTNHFKKRTLQLNNFFHSKLRTNCSNEPTHNHQSDERSTSPPHVFHAIAPASSEEINKSSQYAHNEQKPHDESKSPLHPRINHVLAHTVIKAMTTDHHSAVTQSNNSEEDENSPKFYPVLSSIDADADESDNSPNKTTKKPRRLQKTHRTSIASLQQKYENNNCKDEQQQSSSDENENKESNLITNGHNERRTKLSLVKRFDRLPAATTIDKDKKQKYDYYHPLDNLESKLTATNESTPLNPKMTVSTNQSSVKKVNRFQVKSIRKSQQPQIMLANTVAAKSSNNDDYSVSNKSSNLSSKSSSIERQHTNTPTTDIENPVMNTNHTVNGTISTSISVESGHNHVHFQATSHEKQDSAADDEKSPNLTVTAVTVPLTTPHSSTASAQGEDDEEEEAVAKSPDNRFIKYAKEIGRGAFKTVYRGLDTETSVAVAWCELQDFAQFDKHERARFKEEAEMLKKLQHPNIVRFFDFWEETNPRTNKKVIILVTELMTSGSLKGYIRKFKGQKEEKRINVMKKWCRQILKGLAYLHSRNPPVIHRDLKCDNIFVSSTTGSVKIGDLGLATFKTQTFAKSMRGTMEFMAPEMFDEKYDELVDIYSFGLCMLEMMTGEYPYIECKGPTAVIKRVTAGLKPDCYYKVESEDVREVIDCCIRTKKEERLPVHELLQHSFFLDNNGLRIDFVRDPTNHSQVMVTNNSINLKLKVVDKTKRKSLWTEHEALLFRYNLTTDTPEQIADELIKTNYIFDEDKKFVIQSIKDRVRAYQYELIDRQAGVFGPDGKPTISQTSQSSFTGQQQQISTPQQQVLPLSQQQVAFLQQQQQVPPTQQQSGPPLLAQPQVSLPSMPSTLPVIQQPPMEVQQQQQQQMVKPLSEISSTKSVGVTEPIAIPQLPEHGTSVSGSAGSLEILNEALKKTFTKSNTSPNTNTTSAITNDISEQIISLANQDDSSVLRLGSDTAVVDQQQIDESVVPLPVELTTNIFHLSTPSTLQTQSQPTTMLTTSQQQMLQNPLLLTQPSHSFSYSTAPPAQHLITTILPNDTIKQPITSSLTTALVPTETIENSLLSTSSAYTNETLQPSIPSDTLATPQQPILGSLEQLDALLKDTFKASSKTAATTNNSDTELTNTNVSSIPLIINDEISSKTIEIESDLINKFDEKNRDSNPIVSSFTHSEPNTSSIIIPKPIQQVKSQPTSQIPTYFDPLISSEKDIGELDTLLQTINERSVSNDDTIVATSSNDLSEIKSMIFDLTKTVLKRMDIIESKIEEHKNQTRQLNNLLTKTVLPSFIDLATIVHETPNLDPSVKTKLENIQTNIRIIQQQKQTDMKDLMEI
ncbi:unnamed protein product [Rotaria sp. Silwood1]|nr:unnamed protein product [Rotaria sp. Silwood1]CAF4573960.1 unnamed protein product [Rotaria sp. Silwood1]CAF4863238.1 unnamed protein product [Rotaria sp. Silwood1]